MNTRLWTAAQQNQPAVCRDLLSYGVYGDLCAQINSKGEQDWMALHIAADLGHTDVCKVLMQCAEEIDLDAVTDTGKTPLHLAAAKGFLDMVQILVNAGAELNKQDIDGNTPLHIASIGGFSELVEWLLGKSPDVGLKNKHGKTAYQEAGSRAVAEDFEIYYDFRRLDYERIFVQDCTSNPKSASGRDELDRLLVQAETCPSAQRLLVDRMKLPVTDQVRRNTRRFSLKSKASHDVDIVEYSDFIPKRLLGKGSFGEVYLVVKRDSGQLFALKVLKKENIIGQELMKYALAERNVLGYITHPFIVHLNFAFQTPEKLVLIMDYCPGGDLGKVIQRERRLPEDRARIYACEILLAIEELHRNNILYRDLKPENVLIDSQGHAVLTDFGLSKENAPASAVAMSFCGSVAYLAPEVLKRQGHQQAVDWYLFGTLLYEMLVGTPPYFSRDKNELFHNIKHGKLRLPKQASSEAKDLITKLLERNPRDRLGSGPLGTAEIKDHPFFAGIDWDMVLRRQLRPPLPVVPKLLPENLPKLETVFGELSKDKDHQRIEGWSFINPNQI
jgi:serine/threonine protein kinase